jgi:hypothetical protein
MSDMLEEVDGKLFCQGCGTETDEYGDAKTPSRECSYYPIDCEECGAGWCDQSC